MSEDGINAARTAIEESVTTLAKKAANANQSEPASRYAAAARDLAEAQAWLRSPNQPH